MVSVESVDFGSSELEFGTSVSARTLAWASKISPSGSWINSYVPSANGVISIWNVIVGKNSKVLFLHDKVVNSINQAT